MKWGSFKMKHLMSWMCRKIYGYHLQLQIIECIPLKWVHEITWLSALKNYLYAFIPVRLGFLCPLKIRIKVILSVCSLTIVRLQVKPGIVSTWGVAHIVFWESILVFPSFCSLLRAQLRDGEILLPVVGPVKFSRWWLSSSMRARKRVL